MQNVPDCPVLEHTPFGDPIIEKADPTGCPEMSLECSFFVTIPASGHHDPNRTTHTILCEAPMPSRTLSQPSILSASRPYGLSLTYRESPGSDPERAARRLVDAFDPGSGVVGLGEPLIRNFRKMVPGLRTFPAFSGPACAIPSTQESLWILISGTDRTEVFERFESLSGHLSRDFVLEDAMDTFIYAGGRDLTGYEDGTENPIGADSLKVALVDRGKGLQGSSFVAVQRWVHDLDRFHAHSKSQRNTIIGRRQDTNEELEDAPASAHVKRSAQESFDPAAFILRRSMPWSRGPDRGLEFIAFGKSLDAFERILRRMTGLDDGIVDALFTFSRPIRGGYYWCPPVRDNRLDLSYFSTSRIGRPNGGSP